MLKPDNSPKTDETNLSNSKIPNINEYAGIKLSDEAYKVLTHLMTYNYDFADGLSAVKEYLPKDLFNDISRDAIEYRSRFRDYESIGDKGTLLLYALNNELAAKFNEKIDSAIALEISGNSPSSQILDLLTAKYLMEYYLSNEDMPHQTNISEVISAMSPVSVPQYMHPYKIRTRKLFNRKLSHLPLQKILNPSTELLREFSCSSDCCKYDTDSRTLLSRQILKSLFSNIDEARAIFISNLHIKYGDLSILCRALNLPEQIKRNKPLCQQFLLGTKLRVTQDGRQIFLEWSNPGNRSLTSEMRINYNIFINDLKPFQTLLRELGGDLVIAPFKESHSRVTIVCPPAKSETPSPASLANAFTTARVDFATHVPFLTFDIKDEKGKTLHFRIDGLVLDNPAKTGNTAHLLSEVCTFVSEQPNDSTTVFNFRNFGYPRKGIVDAVVENSHREIIASASYTPKLFGDNDTGRFINTLF